MNITVQPSFSTQLEYQDVLVLNPIYAKHSKDDRALVVTESGRQLILSASFDDHVPDDKVGLSHRQRKFLQVDIGQSISLHLNDGEITLIPVIQKIDIMVSRYFFGGEPLHFNDKIPQILNQFNLGFSQHVLNKGHFIPIKVQEMLFDVKIQKLIDGEMEREYGVMSPECKIFVDIYDPFKF